MNKYILRNKDGEFYRGETPEGDIRYSGKSRCLKFWGREKAEERAKELCLQVVEHED